MARKKLEKYSLVPYYVLLMTAHHNLRRLRGYLGQTQGQMAALAGCSLHLVQSIEIKRMKLSAKIANEISRRTGVSEEWLLTDDPQAEMVAVDGKPYTLKTFEQRQLDFHFSEGAHYRWRQIQLGVGFDLLLQMLDAAASEGKVREFAEWFENVVTRKLGEDFHALDDTVRGNHRRAREAAMNAGKAIPLSLLEPFSPEPFKRVRARMAQAIAAVTAGIKREKRAKSELNPQSRNC
jgi:transcriptional regulator with XRE-family HTH domain